MKREYFKELVISNPDDLKVGDELLYYSSFGTFNHSVYEVDAVSKDSIDIIWREEQYRKGYKKSNINSHGTTGTLVYNYTKVRNTRLAKKLYKNKIIKETGKWLIIKGN